MTDARACLLCATGSAQPLHADDGARYFECATCALIFMHPADRLTLSDEHARYRQHRNDAADPEYVHFLRRLADPAIEQLQPGARGLDFGCGPTPVLSELLTSDGFPCEAYDPLFLPDARLLAGPYDFVTCSEVVEHLHDPRATFALFAQLLSRGGLLAMMTRFHGHEAPFARWWYRRDPTHVCFYAEPTMRWIASEHGWTVAFPRTHVALFTVPS